MIADLLCRAIKRKRSLEAGRTRATAGLKLSQVPHMAGSPGIDDSLPAHNTRIQPSHEIMRSGSSAHAKKAVGSSASKYQYQDSSAEYAVNVLNGLRSLGVQTVPSLDRLLADRYGHVSLRGFPAFHVIGQGSDFGGEGFTRECSPILPSGSHQEVDESIERDEDKWGSVLSGVGYQFEHSRGGKSR